MKASTTLATVIFEYLLVTGVQQFSLAAPTLQTRGTEYRNVLFGNYLCHVQKAADLVWNKIQVRLKCSISTLIIFYNHLFCNRYRYTMTTLLSITGFFEAM